MAKHTCSSCGHKWDIAKGGPFCPKCELNPNPKTSVGFKIGGKKRKS